MEEFKTILEERDRINKTVDYRVIYEELLLKLIDTEARGIGGVFARYIEKDRENSSISYEEIALRETMILLEINSLGMWLILKKNLRASFLSKFKPIDKELVAGLFERMERDRAWMDRMERGDISK